MAAAGCCSVVMGLPVAYQRRIRLFTVDRRQTGHRDVKPLPALNFLTVSQTRINIARLMQPEPPQFIDPLRLARQGAEISGRLQISELARFRDAVIDDASELEYRLEFGRDTAGVHCIMGHLGGVVQMTCQRCLQPMPVRIGGEIRLGIVQGEEEARRLPPEFEPLLAGQEPLRLAELIEDEALLLLPIAPLHEDSGCAGDIAAEVSAATPAEQQHETHRPFAGLDSLRRQDE